MRLSEQQLFDYIMCPAYYDMKYNKRIGFKEEPTMQKLLDKVSKYFYSNLLDKKVCTMNELKHRWDIVCEQNKDYINSKRNLEGMNYIVNFARWAANNKLMLADFDSTYIIRVHNVEIEGTLGPVAVLPGRKCELIVNRFSNREPEQNAIDKQLKYTLDCYAFNEATGHQMDAVRVIHFKNNKEFTTMRSQIDYDRMKTTIDGVAKGIEAGAFYPRESVFCSTCPMKSYCRYWN